MSQGNLQVMFEYQTLICQLTGMDVSNASLYDGGSAAIEAVLLAMSVTKRPKKVVVAGQRASASIARSCETYFTRIGAELVTVADARAASPTPADVAAAIDDETACVLVQHPNFFGCLEDVAALAKAATTPVRCWCSRSIRSAWACSSGRAIWGPTWPWPKGNRWARRCSTAGRIWASWPAASSSSAACRAASPAKRSIAAAAAAGCSRCKPASSTSAAKRPPATSARTKRCSPCGPRSICRRWGRKACKRRPSLCVRKAHYAPQEHHSRSAGLQRRSRSRRSRNSSFATRRPACDDLLAAALDAGYLAGIPLGQWYPELMDCFLVSVTEKRTKDEIDGIGTATVH